MVESCVNNPDFVFGIHRSDAINGADFENDDVLDYMKSSYKRSTGAVLVVIPSKYLDEDGGVMPGMENEVYNQSKRQKFLS